MSTNNGCPCGTGKIYSDCCQPYHLQQSLPETAEQLMRSSYSAFVMKLGDYLLYTRHPSMRHLDSLQQLQESFKNTTWTGLKILSREQGSTKDNSGYVSFAASYQDTGTSGSTNDNTLVERSRFKKEGRQWYYVEADFNMGRNDFCWCGSGKKFKKCHGR